MEWNEHLNASMQKDLLFPNSCELIVKSKLNNIHYDVSIGPGNCNYFPE